MSRINVTAGDITEMHVDAIVNAASSTLLGGGGVDGAIHCAAGPQLLQACKALCGCDTGQAKLTMAYKLPCRYMIHTVGPVWQGGTHGEAGKLRACYENSLRLAQESGIRSIAFPAISTGVYGYPLKEAAAVAVDSVKSILHSDRSIEKVIFVCFSKDAADIYTRLLYDSAPK